MNIAYLFYPHGNSTFVMTGVKIYGCVMSSNLQQCYISNTSVDAVIGYHCNRVRTSIVAYDTIRYDTIEEFNVDSKAEYTA